MSDYWDEQLNTDGGDTYTPDMTADEYGGSEVNEAIQLALGGGTDVASSQELSSWWSAIDFTSPTEDRLNTDVQGGAGQATAGNATSGVAAKTEGKGLIGRIADFANQNKSLTEMVLKGIGGAASARSTQKSAMAQINRKDELERARNAEYSASISNLAKPGLIQRQQQLRRLDGTPVFTNGRIV